MEQIHLSRGITINSNQAIEDMPSIVVGDKKIIGYKILTFKFDDSTKGEQGEPLKILDKNQPPIYDKINQLFFDKENLQTLLAQSTANNAQSSVDVENLKQQNAQLVQQIAQLQIQGGSNNG